jgi:hypothetical protein
MPDKIYDSYECVSDCPEWTERKLLFLLAEHFNKLRARVIELEKTVKQLQIEKGP